MNYNVILISGTLASGKDTPNNKLFELDQKFFSFTKQKATNSKDRDGNYKSMSILEFNKKIEHGNFIQYHERYGNYYGISVTEFQTIVNKEKISIIYVGKHENLKTLMNDKRISNPLSRLFYVSKNQEKRLKLRHFDNLIEITKRIKVYDEEIGKLQDVYLKEKKLLFHKVFKNEDNNIENASERLLCYIKKSNSFQLINEQAIEELLTNV